MPRTGETRQRDSFPISDELRSHVAELEKSRPSVFRKIALGPLEPANLRRAVDCMRQGGVVFFFSRATYGFATSGLSREGVEGVYRLKGREYDKPLAMLCTPDQVEHWATVNASARGAVRSLTSRFWPGGVSLVLPKRRDAAAQPIVPDFMTSGIPTVSLMCMDDVAYALADLAEYPIAATSANRSGSPPVTDPVVGIESFGAEVDLLLIGPPSDIGANTTIVDLATDPPRVLRSGPVPYSELVPLVRGLVQ